MMQRRDFITLLGGAAAAWPLVAGAQPRERMRRVGFLWSAYAADDPNGQGIGDAFVQGLQERGWSVGRNLRIDHRRGLSNAERLRKGAEELVALAPDVLFAGGGPALAALQQTTSTVPIVFANVADPVGAGHVESLARPGGNVTGFMNIEYGLSAKYLELLKQIAPQVTRVGVFRPSAGGGIGQLTAIQAVAPSLGVEVRPLTSETESEVERSVEDFARVPNGGLIITQGVGAGSAIQRNLIIALAARHRLPAAYFSRLYVVAGGLVSYGPDILELYRLSAAYVDRILRGQKPAELPVQAPTKYETVLNLKTAKALDLTVPDLLLVRADEVIE
jgi:putative tryptophan/tyrosine transport system substrate-binding protein